MMIMPWIADYDAQTDTGRVRKKNQDRPIADAERKLFAVSDGMGGIPFGEETARLAVEMVPPLMDGQEGRTPKEVALSLREGLDSVSNAIRDCGNDEDHGVIFGATISGFAVVENHDTDNPYVDYCAIIFNMGDSRVYRLRNDKLECMTKDHSIIQILLDTGEITPEEAKTHPARGSITRFLGMVPEAAADVSGVDIQAGDRFLVCSDGLHGMVSEEQLKQLLSADDSAHNICERMVNAANEAGGLDNITAVVWIAKPVEAIHT